MGNSQILSYICQDIMSIVVTFLISWALVEFVQPSVQGFYCQNIFIRYPQKHSTISETGLLNSSIGFPTCYIVGLESLIHWLKKPLGLNKTIFALKLLNTIAVFYTAFNMQYIIGTSMKLSAGEPRPNFLDTCKPNIDCSKPSVSSRFVNVYNCTSDKAKVRRARGGFLSVKASSITTSMVYISLLTHFKLRYNEIFLGKLFLQFLFISFALFVGASRVVDHEHRWPDVILGFCLGIGTSFAAVHVTNWFQQEITIYEETNPRFSDDIKMRLYKVQHKKGLHIHPGKVLTKSPRRSLKHSPDRHLRKLTVKKMKMVSSKKLSNRGKKQSKKGSQITEEFSPSNSNNIEPLLQ